MIKRKIERRIQQTEESMRKNQRAEPQSLRDQNHRGQRSEGREFILTGRINPPQIYLPMAGTAGRQDEPDIKQMSEGRGHRPPKAGKP